MDMENSERLKFCGDQINILEKYILLLLLVDQWDFSMH